jgi:hypothetical protein
MTDTHSSNAAAGGCVAVVLVIGFIVGVIIMATIVAGWYR